MCHHAAKLEGKAGSADPAAGARRYRGPVPRWTVYRLCRAAILLAVLVPVWLVPVWLVPAMGAEPPGSEAFIRHVDELLRRESLGADNVSLLIQEVGVPAPAYSLNPDASRIPASNAKLVTSYVALRELTANHRWRTDLYLVKEQIDPVALPRQGLLVTGGGDPTLRRSDLQAMALRLRLNGIDRIDGPLYYDDRLFAGPTYPEAWGDVEEAMPWYAPVGPFVLNLNTAKFLLVVHGERREVEIIPRQFLPAVQYSKQFTWIEDGRELLDMRQVPSVNGLVFAASGSLVPMPRTYSMEVAILDPVDHYFRQFRQVLHDAGIQGDMPLRRFTGVPPASGPVYSHPSRPLGSFLPEMNKESNNLVAEVVLRSLALRDRGDGVTAADGLRVVREVIAHDFPAHAESVVMVDGSGLGRESRVTAAFLVDLLSGVLNHFEFRAEYLNSLSVSGWDGTLQNRRFPRRHWGRVRAKSGTLRGVQNLAGYYSFGDRVLIFAFLIEDESRDYATLQASQDRVLTGLFDFVMGAAVPPASVKRQPIPALAPPLPPVPRPKRPPSSTVLSD